MLGCHIKTEDFYAIIASDVKARFDRSGYNKNDARPLPTGLNKKVIGLMKDELGGAVMSEFMALRPKLKTQQCRGCQMQSKQECVVKRMIISFDDYKNCLLDVKRKSIYRTQLMFKNNKHKIRAVEVLTFNKVALNRDDDKYM